MKSIMVCGKCALVAFILFGVVEAWAGAENADARAAVARSHASLRAYPSAVISLKDPKTEMIFYVESNGRRLVALEKNGTVVWNVDVVEAAKASPGVGQQVIRDLKVGKHGVQVTFAKHSYAEVQLQSGKVTFLGSD